MSDNKEQMRSEFEAWLTEEGEHPLFVVRSADGKYKHSPAKIAWDAWQAATAIRQASAAASIRALKCKLPDYRDYAMAGDQRGCHRDGYRAGFRAALYEAAKIADCLITPPQH